jgi:hypothetical protein
MKDLNGINPIAFVMAIDYNPANNMRMTLVVFSLCLFSLFAAEWRPALQIRGNHGYWTYERQSVALKTEGFIDEGQLRPRIYLEISRTDTSGPSYETVTIDEIAMPLSESLSKGKQTKTENFFVKFGENKANIGIRKGDEELLFSMNLSDSKMFGEHLKRLSILIRRIALDPPTIGSVKAPSKIEVDPK